MTAFTDQYSLPNIFFDIGKGSPELIRDESQNIYRNKLRYR
jgi:hypothetical protein